MAHEKKRRLTRHLRPEEERLWRSVTDLVSPLNAESKQPKPSANVPISQNPATDEFFQTKRKMTSILDSTPRMQAKKADRHKRDKPHIDACLDLHGLTQAEAYAVLREALALESAKGSSVLLVITGKGSKTTAPDYGAGVLRRQVPMWMSTFPETSKIELAHRSDGGEGALYVHIRKQVKRSK